MRRRSASPRFPITTSCNSRSLERKTFVHATELPPQLRPVLKDLPNGMATPVLTEDGKALHVLVVCSRS